MFKIEHFEKEQMDLLFGFGIFIGYVPVFCQYLNLHPKISGSDFQG